MCRVELSWSVLGFIGFAFREIGASSPIMSRRNRGDGEALKGSNPSVIKTAQRAFSAASTESNAATVLNSPAESREKKTAVFSAVVKSWLRK
jgi:hypothetical protein